MTPRPFSRQAHHWGSAVRRFVPLRWRQWLAVLLMLLVFGGSVATAYGFQALQVFWVGSVGSWYGLTSATLVRAVPLIFCGLAVAIAFRAGVFNIGGDGQFLAGATVAVVVALHGPARFPTLTMLAALLAGGLAGSLWAGIAALLRLRFGILEVISTLMLNFLAADLVSYLVRGPLQEPRHIYPQTLSIPTGVRLPAFGPETRLHWGLVIALVLAVLAAWLVSRTAAGFRLRVVGANIDAARTTGRIAVNQVTTQAFLVSGALAGLAGAVEVLGVTFALYENLSPGYGFTAIAVAILADLQPLGVVVTATLFAILETGATAMQRDAGVPTAWASVVEACLILVIIAAAALRTRNTFVGDAS